MSHVILSYIVQGEHVDEDSNEVKTSTTNRKQKLTLSDLNIINFFFQLSHSFLKK